MAKILVNFFLLGVAFGAGPCIASCGPLVISYIAGTKKDILRGLWVYILFSSARLFAYILLGLLVFAVGRFTMERFSESLSKYVLIAGGAFIIIVGIFTALGHKLESKICKILQKNVVDYDNKSIIIMGLTIGLIPCAPLLALFSYSALISKSWLESLGYIFSFGIGTMISPLVFLVIFAGLIRKLLIGRKKIYEQAFSFICGLVIIFLGVQLIMRGVR